jgi:hypothetical protein
MNTRLLLASMTLAVISVTACFAAPVSKTEFYVATNGSDLNPGTKSRPFASLDRARDAIRALKQNGELYHSGVQVFVRGGDYYLSEPFRLFEEDSGTEAQPVVYCAYPGENVRLVGGRRITSFARVTDPAILVRFDESARRSVLQADLKSQGITEFGEMTRYGFGIGARTSAPELFFNGRPMMQAEVAERRMAQDRGGAGRASGRQVQLRWRPSVTMGGYG